MASVHKRTWTHKGVEKFKWVVRFTEDGKQKQKTFDKNKEAIKFAALVTTGEHKEEIVANRTVAAVCEDFLRYAEDKLRDGRIGPGRMCSFRTLVSLAVKPHIGSLKMADLTSVVIEDWYRKMCRTPRNGKASGATLKPMTVRTRIKDFKLVQEFARKRGWLTGSPVSEALKDLRGLSYDRVRTFSAEDVKALFRANRVRRARLRVRTHALLNCYIHLAAFCGLRYSEIAGLKVSSVDFARSIILVRHSVDVLGKVKGPKTRAGIRDIPMPSPVAKMLKEWVDCHYNEKHGEFLFRTPRGKLLGNSNFHRCFWRPLLREAGLEGEFHFHALRHFCASYLIDNGMSVMDVARILGHSSFDMTLQVYAHPVDSGSRRLESMERIAGLLTFRPEEMGVAATP